MDINFGVKKVNYNEKIRSLTTKASGVVKSNKFFPVYLIDNKEYIFKPLSKTKPFTTPLFSYAEVVWSYITNRYFCYAPQYELASCVGYEENEKKYYDNGCLVEYIVGDGEHLINLLEYFRKNPDKNVNIDDYINYCMDFYDYIPIFKSEVIKNNRNIGKDLAMQVLLSILKADQNFHYENVMFVCDNAGSIIKLAPMLDHEFSTMFLFPDKLSYHIYYFDKYVRLLSDKESVIRKNIAYIKENYFDVFDLFINAIDKLYEDVEKLQLQDNGFLFSSNSFLYEAGRERFKNNNEEKAKVLEQSMELIDINLEVMNNLIVYEIKEVIKNLKRML